MKNLKKSLAEIEKEATMIPLSIKQMEQIQGGVNGGNGTCIPDPKNDDPYSEPEPFGG